MKKTTRKNTTDSVEVTLDQALSKNLLEQEHENIFGPCDDIPYRVKYVPDGDNTSLQQPSLLRIVPSVTTYGTSEYSGI